MDIDALHSALLSLTVLPEQIRSARANVSVSNGGTPSAFEEFLSTMERDLRIAKATLARELGFPICRCCWPPELLAKGVDGREYCPASPKTASIINLAGHRHSPGATVASKAAKARRLDSFARSQKNKLLGLRDAAVDSIAGVSKSHLRPRAEGVEAPAFVGDRADAGSDASECDLALNLLSQEHDALREIDQALLRIETGAYGTCEISGKPIPRARLEAIPFARHTVECQSQIENQRKAVKARQPVTSLLDVEPEENERDEEENPQAKRRPSTLAERIVVLESAEASLHPRSAVVLVRTARIPKSRALDRHSYLTTGRTSPSETRS